MLDDYSYLALVLRMCGTVEHFHIININPFGAKRTKHRPLKS